MTGRPARNDTRVAIPTVKLPPELVVAIDTECDRLVIGRNKLIEIALEYWLDHTEDPQPMSDVRRHIETRDLDSGLNTFRHDLDSLDVTITVVDTDLEIVLDIFVELTDRNTARIRSTRGPIPNARVIILAP